MKVVINTPTGKIGSSVVQRLLQTDRELILLSRNPERLQPFIEQGAAVQTGNLEDAGFVVEATRGADLLFWVTPADTATDDLRKYYNQLGRTAVRAVKENKIGRVINLSSIGAQHESGTGPIAGLHDIEKMFDECDCSITHLRPAFFMENFFMSAGTIAGQGAAFLPCKGSTSMEMIATADIARVAFERILDREWKGHGVLELAGPAALSFDQAAEIIGSVLGKDVSHIEVTPEQTREAMTGLGISAGVANTYLEMYAAFDAGMIAPENPAELMRTQTSFDTFVKFVFAPLMQAME